MANVTQVVSPLTLEQMNVDGGLLREAWANQIYLESLQVDPLINAPTLTESIGAGNDGQKVPEKIFMNVTKGISDSKGVRDVVLSFLKSLSGDGNFGRDVQGQAGEEEQMSLKYCKFFSHDWSHAVAAETFGIDFRELSPYDIYERAKPLLAQWLGELDGLFARQAICETRSENLAKAPLSLTQPINPNVYIMDATAPVPTYTGVADDYEDNVVDALESGNVTCDATTCHFTVSNLLTLSDVANDAYIRPMKIGGYDAYILCMCPDEYRRMIDPAVTGSWQAFYKEVAATSDIAAKVPGAMGMVGDSIIITRDRRAATAVVSSSDVTFGYMKMGRNDTRSTNRVANQDFNCNALLGQGALAKYISENPHYEEQRDRYGQFKGVGYFGAFAWQLCQWDDDALGTSSDTSTQQEGSMLVFTTRVLV